MTLLQANRLFAYWENHPPEHDILAMLARVYTTWGEKPMSEAEHRASLEARWRAGAMNVKQAFEAWGGGPMTLDGSRSGAPPKLPGIGPFPSP